MSLPDHLQHLRTRRFLTLRDLPAQPPGHCRWCGRPVSQGRRTWCSQDCVDAYMIRSSGSSVGYRIRERDQGVCAICGYPTAELEYLVRDKRRRFDLEPIYWGPWWSAVYDRRSLSEADHIVPVVEGGGCCGLENYRTLCVPCHKAETAALAARRARARDPQTWIET